MGTGTVVLMATYCFRDTVRQISVPLSDPSDPIQDGMESLRLIFACCTLDLRQSWLQIKVTVQLVVS